MLPSAHDDPFAQFKVTFFEECSELLADVEQHLADLESGEYESETLHAIFRAVHSIKAGAGAFSFTRMVAFSHKFEYLLDELREGRLEVEPDLVSTLFRAFDVLSDLVGFAQNGEDVEEAYGQDALDRIEQFLEGSGDAPASVAASVPAAPATVSVASAVEKSDVAPQMQHFRIEFTPREAMYRHANEPLLIIRELRDLGRTETTVDISRLPSLATMEPEDAYFSWVFDLWTNYGRAEIDEVFEFVVDDCDLTIITLDAADTVVAVDVSPGHEDIDDDDGFGFFVDESDIKAGAVAAPGTIKTANKTVPAAVSSETKEPSDSPKTATSSAPPKSLVKVASIRVDVDRVDKLVNMVGELVITQSMLAQEVEDGEGTTTNRVASGMDILSTHIRELQENVMSIRMQPVKSVFSRMPRIVRDVSKKLGKKVRLVTVGEDTEVDKTVIEELADPLTHMIRNSLDHGLEIPAERLAAGKAEEGTIQLSAEHRGGRIIIEIIDDGRGINREKVLSLAKEKGVIAFDAELSDSEVDNLIFAPGFSTADEVTDLSGRGVGMDVVRRNIQSLGGRVSVQSFPGRGTRFQLTLPLTLAVLDGMIVGVANQKYVIPINSIIETVRPSAKDVEQLVGGGRVVRIRGEYIRVLPVSRIFGLPGGEQDPSKGLVILVETEGGKTVGLLVDELAGQQQVVIKSLESNYKAVEGVASATILGNGSVCLILDVDALSKMPALAAKSANGALAAKSSNIGFHTTQVAAE
jgi:two-component system, chemotaxis family, sensor kinase CheA